MRAMLCPIWVKEEAYMYEVPQVKLEYSGNEPVKVAIGLDPSSTCTGFTMGLIDSNTPLFGMEFVRGNNEDPYMFISDMINYIVFNIIGVNLVNVQYIFSEDKYERSGKYSRHTQELLSTVKSAVNSLPSRVVGIGKQKNRPKLYIMKPTEWRKVFLGDKNTNAKRSIMKKLDSMQAIEVYNLHPNYSNRDDMLDSMGIYYAGYKKYIELSSSESKMVLVDLNRTEWNHHIQYYLRIVKLQDIHKNLDEINDPIMKERALKFGMKYFDYVKGKDLENNMRGLTSNSNSVFFTLMKAWDMDAIPLYYETGITPINDVDSLLVIFYRKIIKEDFL